MRSPATYLPGIALLACIALPALGAEKFLSFRGEEGPGKGKKIVLISGDQEYRSEEVMPMLAKILSQRHGFDCVVLFSWSKDGTHIDPNNGASLEGLEQLDDADLMICATRFRTPPAEPMKSFDQFLDAGKPVIGMRTATHGFQGKWEFFGMQILGERWDGHHGRHKQEGCRGVIEPANANHAILNGVKDVFAPSDVYGVSHLQAESTILLRGAVTESLDPASQPIAGEKNAPMQPLAWIRSYVSPGGGHGQAVCTTMGASVDLVGADARRLIVNAALYLTGLTVPAAANVDFVDPFYPSFYGFIKDEQFWPRRDMQAEDYGLGKAPLAVDPPSTPNWPFREMGPAAAAASSQQVDPSGTWRWQYEWEGATIEDSLHLSLDKTGNVGGDFIGENATAQVKQGSIEGDKLSIKTAIKLQDTEMALNFSGSIEGDAIDGQVVIGVNGETHEFPWNPTRSVQLEDVVGTWQLQIKRRDGDSFEPTLKIAMAGEQTESEYTSMRGDKLDVQDLRIEENMLMFTATAVLDGYSVRVDYQGRPYGNKIDGTLEYDLAGNRGEAKFTAKRSPAK